MPLENQPKHVVSGPQEKQCHDGGLGQVHLLCILFQEADAAFDHPAAARRLQRAHAGPLIGKQGALDEADKGGWSAAPRSPNSSS